MWSMRGIKRTVGAACLCAALLAFTGCAKPEAEGLPQAQLAEKKTTYHTETVRLQNLTRTAQLSCDPSYRLIQSVRTGGADLQLKTLLVSRNQDVEKGDPIALMQGSGSQADVAQKELEIAAYRAGCQETTAYYEGLVRAAEALPGDSELARQKRALRVEYAETELALYTLRAEAGLQAMETALDAARAAAGETVIYAPLSGSVRSLVTKYKEGDMVPAGTELCSIYGADSLLLYGNSGNSTFVYGREVTVRLGRSGSERTITGTVVSSPEVSPPEYYSTGVFVRVDPAEINERNFQGRLEVSFTVMKDVLAVPKTAVTTQDGVPQLSLLEGEATRTRGVVRGPSVGMVTPILQGLREGDQVVVSSYND